MRLSCNGCRVLRKGCSADCPIRPCLQWIPSPESQSNATLFLAKFYGRAGLINLINSGAPHVRPAIFKSWLYEACGRIVNPIFGSAGLLSSGSWHLCQAAVEAVLRGAPITTVSLESACDGVSPLLKSCDIRHVGRKGNSTACVSDKLHKVVTTSGSQFKRAGAKQKKKPQVVEPVVMAHSGSELDGSGVSEHRSRGGSVSGEADSSTVETVEASPAPARSDERSEAEDGEVELELTLWWGQDGKSNRDMNGSDANTCKLQVGIDHCG
ncbi:LOB domain-containing protein 41-like [Senna tora]|uniref:LOB domain-containing protein 41-like n=1 Tax=Senna tora TaxID=362788 RepID=A0A834TF04_9FABA|nr:LOB domain-containing protein 41-like [Senna tora]